MYVHEWKHFLESKEGRKLVPNWKRWLEDTFKYMSLDEQNKEPLVEEQYEDWMLISRMVSSNDDNISHDLRDEIDITRHNFSKEQIHAMPSWLDNEKKNCHDKNIFIPNVDIGLFNEEQSLAYKIVESHFKNSDTDPLRLMITEQGGSGKSFLINGLRQLLGEQCIVSSYFGIAAYNINGVTLHSLLNMPIRGKNSCDLKGRALTDLQIKFKDVKYLIIDEFSVIGQRMLGWIDRRLREASSLKTTVFGGFSVIFVGDFAQLPPVSDKPMYFSQPSGTISLMGFVAYMKIDKVVKLVQNQRVSSQSEVKFCELLLRLRNGASIIEDWQLLCTRNLHHSDSKEFNYSAIRMAYTNEIVAKYNFNMLKQQKGSIFNIKVLHNKSKALQLHADEYGGLQPILNISVGSKVMLLKNLWVEKGLCNGAMGQVTAIIYSLNNNPAALPVAVMVKFNGYEGPCFEKTNSIPIIPVTVTSADNGNCEGTQLPLKLSWAITIRKSQGLTIPKAIVDLGPSEKVSGLAYVALSRVKRLQDLLIEPISYDRLTAIRKGTHFESRLNEEKR